MERMKRKIGKRKVEIHKMEGLYPYVRLEDFMFVVKQLEEENKKLKSDLAETQKIGESWRQECKQLREELNWWKDLVHKAKEFEYDEDGMDYIWQNTKNL